MKRPPHLPANRLGRGRIVSIASGLAVVLGTSKSHVALAPIQYNPTNAHRADVAIPWADAALMGLSSKDVIRCRPFTMAITAARPTGTELTPAVWRDVWNAVGRELSSQKWEDGNTKKRWL